MLLIYILAMFGGIDKSCKKFNSNKFASHLCKSPYFVFNHKGGAVFKAAADGDLEQIKDLQNNGHDIYHTIDGYGPVALSYINLVKPKKTKYSAYLPFTKAQKYHNAKEILSYIQVPNANKSFAEQHALTKKMLKEVKTIKIPGYDFNFNTGIIKYKDGYLLAFRSDSLDFDKMRRKSMRKKHTASRIGVVKLDADFNVISEANILNDLCTAEVCRTEDPRLATNGKDIWLIYNNQDDFAYQHNNFERSIYVATLKEQGSDFKVLNSVRMVSPFNSFCEKNWAPLVHKNQLYFVYSVEPKTIILKPNVKTGFSEIVSESELATNYQFGVLKNTSNLVKLSNGSYLSILHSYVEKGKHRYYFSVPSLMKCDDSLSDCKMESINHTPMFFDLIPERSTLKAVVLFMSGLVDNDNEIIIAAGKMDSQITILRLDKRQFMSYIDSENSIITE